MSVLLIDVVSTSNCLSALSLSYAVCPSSFNDRTTMIGSVVANNAVICLSKSAGACHGDDNSMG